MCRWEVGKYMIQVNNTKMTVSYVAHLPGGISTNTRRCRREIENEEKSEQELSLESIDCKQCISVLTSFYLKVIYFGNMCHWEVGVYMIQVNNMKMTVSYVAHLPGGISKETLEDAAERLRMKKSEQELSLESIDL
ncbi:hypothetical protein EVAR_70634_1 [Eumeta japonica]|uniref:Uncharacterized protein n=1 Tax=Eumeta variegata TaxID=151549 RepID=A0A4C2A813_EUMVA|nr:hypothetical protein EVAR_70634_1 [Eumeta japonica]